ncbi:homoserine dehydrogenase [Streptomyces sp. NPDC050788]|jgi:homoserine dehydrogenase|uniref:homoserine dehydrogenase n=1 Tax=Streptomyces sp. NPDC050788 TaxID=3155041 RepID=UPI00343CCDB0
MDDVTQVNTVLSGYGPVGQAFVSYLAGQGGALHRRYGVEPRVAAIRASSAQCQLAAGAPVPRRSAWGRLASLEETLERTAAGVFIQAIPSSPELRQHAAEEAMIALRRGVHVVTATKSHLLSHWRDLEAAAQRQSSMIRISGATGAALPAGDLSRTALRGVGCTTIRACLNGTVTYVLDRLTQGASLANAVQEAQRRGIAEADPSADLSGEDAATKVRLLAALAWRWNPTSIHMKLQPVDTDTVDMALEAGSRQCRLRAVATASVDDPYLVRVQLEETKPGDPLHTLEGPEKAVVFGCPDAGDVTVSGGRSSPLGAALALVKDTIDVAAPRIGFL